MELHQIVDLNAPPIKTAHQTEHASVRNVKTHALGHVVSMLFATFRIINLSVNALMVMKEIHILDAMSKMVSNKASFCLFRNIY